MKHLLLFFLLSCSVNLFAQEIDEDFMIDREISGYIVHQTGDTTFGKTLVSTRTKNQVRVKFRADGAKKLTTYKAKNKELLAYGWIIEQKFQSCQSGYGRYFKLKQADQPPVPFSSSTVFMECKAEGTVNLFELAFFYSNFHCNSRHFRREVVILSDPLFNTKNDFPELRFTRIKVSYENPIQCISFLRIPCT